MAKKNLTKLRNIGLAFGLSLISIGILLTYGIKSIQGIGALIVLIAEIHYFFDMLF